MKKKFAFVIFIVALLGLLSIITHSVFFEEDTVEILNGITIFKYFTLQSNLIVAIYFLTYYIGIHSESDFFKKIFGGVVLYISITFIVYLVLLEPILSPRGFNLIGSIFNHYITPILVIGFIYTFREDYSFKFKDVKTWIIYPVVYLMFLIVFGVMTNDYIYPFFQVSKIGIIGLIVSIICNTLFFLLMSFILVKIVSKK